MRTLFTALALVFAACGGDDGQTNPVRDAAIDAPLTPDAGCFSGTPATHDEIINACTTAQKIYKKSNPPLVNADGSLPPLPP
jgi:hypothetical protein